MPSIIEGKTTLIVHLQKTVSRKMPVFYNPVMSFNRDMTIALFNALGRKNLRIALPLAGSGARGIRILKETDAAEEVHFNDLNPSAVKAIHENLKTNGLEETKEIIVSQKDANEFFIASPYFDYIDIDPFGSPNPFLNNAISRLKNEGILAVTATDTSALCGTHPKACMRKYWAIPNHGPMMHELGLRILIRKVQLVAAQYSKALLPVIAYAKDHYCRVIFQSEKGKPRTDKMLEQHGMFENAGPLWLGKLKDQKVVEKMYAAMPSPFLKTIVDEMDVVGFYDLHALCKKYKLKEIPKLEDVLKKTKGTRTHFCPYGVKTKMDEAAVLGAIKQHAY